MSKQIYHIEHMENELEQACIDAIDSKCIEMCDLFDKYMEKGAYEDALDINRCIIKAIIHNLECSLHKTEGKVCLFIYDEAYRRRNV